MLVSASKGVISGSISFTGKSSHSGYPELGEDANAKLLRTATKLLALELGSDPALGIGTINIGYINGGIASNVVSESAELKFSIRTVKDTQSIYHEIEGIVKVEQGLARIGVLEPLILKTVPDFKTCIVSYACDIPHFLPIGAEALMYGPGSITRAHTDFEYIIAAEIEEALEGYQKIYWKLTDLL